MPLVGAEVQRLTHAFQEVSLELSGVLKALRDNDFTFVGTPQCDGPVGAGMRDLGAALSALQQSATDCVSVMGRHGEFVEPTHGDQSAPLPTATPEVQS